MKREEIEELRKHWKMEADPDFDNDGCACDYYTEGLRLLAEREALVEALRDGAGFCGKRDCTSARCALAVAALTLAES